MAPVDPRDQESGNISSSAASQAVKGKSLQRRGPQMHPRVPTTIACPPPSRACLHTRKQLSELWNFTGTTGFRMRPVAREQETWSMGIGLQRTDIFQFAKFPA